MPDPMRCTDCDALVPYLGKGRPATRCETCRKNVRRPCTVDGCTRMTVGSRSVCPMHYKRKVKTGQYGEAGAVRQYGTPDNTRPKDGQRGVCSVPDCGRTHRQGGYCEMHAARVRTAGDPGEAAKRVARPDRAPDGTCIDCGVPASSSRALRCEQCAAAARAATQKRYQTSEFGKAKVARRYEAVRKQRGIPDPGETVQKVCRRCDETYDWFFPGGPTRSFYCPLCLRYKHEWTKFGLTGPQTAAFRADPRCHICHKDVDPGGRHNSWKIDHNHTTGAVRGLLCHACNVALGFMGDDPARLRAAADYLERPTTYTVLTRNAP